MWALVEHDPRLVDRIEIRRTIDALALEGWRMDVGYPEDRDEAERRLAGELELES